MLFKESIISKFKNTVNSKPQIDFLLVRNDLINILKDIQSLSITHNLVSCIEYSNNKDFIHDITNRFGPKEVPGPYPEKSISEFINILNKLKLGNYDEVSKAIKSNKYLNVKNGMVTSHSKNNMTLVLFDLPSFRTDSDGRGNLNQYNGIINCIAPLFQKVDTKYNKAKLNLNIVKNNRYTVYIHIDTWKYE